MIVTVTANPSVDMTLEVEALEAGEVNRALRSSKDPAGKGINVTRALTRNNVVSTAVFPADHATGGWIVESLGHLGVPTVAIPILGEVRQNITIVDASGCTTKINQAGPTLSAAEQEALLRRISDVLATGPAWLVAAGSLPGGMEADFYVQLGELAHAAGVRFAVDASGDALERVCQSGVADLIKPNLEELEELAGRALTTVGDLVDVVRGLPGRAERVTLVSLGEHGAVLITAERVVWAGHPPVAAVSTVGAGDCTLAGFLAADARARLDGHVSEDPLAERLQSAVAWGTAAVQLPATTVPAPEHIHAERVQLNLSPNLNTPIKELHCE